MDQSLSSEYDYKTEANIHQYVPESPYPHHAHPPPLFSQDGPQSSSSPITISHDTSLDAQDGKLSTYH